MRSLLLTAVLIGAGGCTCLLRVPRGELSMDERRALSEQAIAARRASAAALTLADKAAHFERVCFDRFMPYEHKLLPRRIRFSEPDQRAPSVLQGDVSPTAHLLAAMAFKHAATGEPETLGRMHALVDAIRALDAADGFDGYLERCGLVSRDGLRVVVHEPKSNYYTEVLYAYTVAYTLSDDPALKAKIAEHVTRLFRWAQSHAFVFRTADGRPVDNADLTPSRFQVSRSRCLDLLVLLESARLMGDGDARTQANRLLDETIRLGYLRKLQTLHWQGLLIKLPTHSGDWLNFVRLAALLQANPRPEYRRALERLHQTQRREDNPFFNAIAMLYTGSDDEVFFYLEDYPTLLDEREILSPQPRKWLLRFVKLKPVREANRPLLIYERALDWDNWKVNPYRLEDNLGQDASVHYSGADFLLAYWMARYARTRPGSTPTSP